MLHTKNPTALRTGELDEFINVALTAITALHHVETGKKTKIQKRRIESWMFHPQQMNTQMRHER